VENPIELKEKLVNEIINIRQKTATFRVNEALPFLKELCEFIFASFAYILNIIFKKPIYAIWSNFQEK